MCQKTNETLTMKHARWIVVTLIFACASAHAMSNKEANQLLRGKYEITKRNLVGEVKRPGTVIYLRVPGVQAEPPKVMLNTVTVTDGDVVSYTGKGSGKERVSLPVGEPMHIYSVRSSKDSVRFQLGTVNKYPQTMMGSTKDVHYQTAVVFTLNGELKSIDAQELLDAVSAAAATEEEVAALPELQAAIAAAGQQQGASPDQNNAPQQPVASVAASQSAATSAPTGAGFQPESPTYSPPPSFETAAPVERVTGELTREKALIALRNSEYFPRARTIDLPIGGKVRIDTLVNGAMSADRNWGQSLDTGYGCTQRLGHLSFRRTRHDVFGQKHSTYEIAPTAKGNQNGKVINEESMGYRQQYVYRIYHRNVYRITGIRTLDNGSRADVEFVARAEYLGDDAKCMWPQITLEDTEQTGRATLLLFDDGWRVEEAKVKGANVPWVAIQPER